MYRKPYENTGLAEAYVPFQCYTESYRPMEALKRGTLFPELDKPYHKGKRGKR